MPPLPESTQLLFVVVLALGLLALALNLIKLFVGGFAGSISGDEYRLKHSLFSAAERSFLGVLELIDLGDLALSYKVRLADVFDVKKGYSRSRWQSAFNRISAKHIDFLLIRKSDEKPILGIELDDRSHRKANRIKRDEFVDGVFESVGLPLLRGAEKGGAEKGRSLLFDIGAEGAKVDMLLLSINLRARRGQPNDS